MAESPASTKTDGAQEQDWNPRCTRAVRTLTGLILIDLCAAAIVGLQHYNPVADGWLGVSGWFDRWTELSDDYGAMPSCASMILAVAAMTLVIRRAAGEGRTWKGVLGQGLLWYVWLSAGALPAGLLLCGAEILLDMGELVNVTLWPLALTGMTTVTLGAWGLRTWWGLLDKPWAEVKTHQPRRGQVVTIAAATLIGLFGVVFSCGTGWWSVGFPFAGRVVHWSRQDGSHGELKQRLFALKSDYGGTEVHIVYPSQCEWAERRTGFEARVKAVYLPASAGGPRLEQATSDGRRYRSAGRGRAFELDARNEVKQPVLWDDPTTWPCYCPEQLGLSSDAHGEALRTLEASYVNGNFLGESRSEVLDTVPAPFGAVNSRIAWFAVGDINALSTRAAWAGIHSSRDQEAYFRIRTEMDYEDWQGIGKPRSAMVCAGTGNLQIVGTYGVANGTIVWKPAPGDPPPPSPGTTWRIVEEPDRDVLRFSDSHDSGSRSSRDWYLVPVNSYTVHDLGRPFCDEITALALADAARSGVDLQVTSCPGSP